MLVGGRVSIAVLILVLIFASIVDFKHHKIPNMLSAFTAFYGVSVHAYVGAGMLLPLSGMAMGLIIFLPFHIGGGMGAGDVKLMSAIGAVLGMDVVYAAGLSLIVGSLMGLSLLILPSEGREALKGYARMVFRLFRWGAWTYEKPAHDHVRAQQFPYAVAIATGTLLTVGFIIY